MRRHTINSINKHRSATNRDDSRRWFEEIEIEGVKIRVKLDSGAECNVIPKTIADQLGGKHTACKTKLVTYSGHKMTALSQITTKAKVRGNLHEITFIVVNEKTEPILGLQSCDSTGLIKRIDDVAIDPSVFNGLGCLKNFEYDIEFVENPSFEIHPARRIPHAYRQQVKDELDSMVKKQVIREVTEATPAVSPMVVVKQRGRIRICIDPTDVNKNVLRRHYPLKTLEEIAAKVNGSTIFTKLDCTKGFWQIKLSERSQKFLTFATPWGRYSCLKLPFGLCSAPEVFQQIMSNLLKDIEKAEASMDDILIYAATKAELDIITNKVIKRIKDAGLTLNKDKCEFGVPKIKFLGHLLSAQGVEIDPEKVTAINQLKDPENKAELQRLLGMVTYLAKFIPKLSEMTYPLRQLIEKDAEWLWTPHQQQAVEQIKHALSSAPVLKFYNVNKNVIIQCDASSYALGAVLIQDGQPVAYTSRALTDAEKNYPQIEKEALAIRFACKKFHEYIYGKQLIVETDHKPLESIFKKIISTAPPRLQRILLEIAPYSPTVVYRKGETMYLADILSRDCINDNKINNIEEEFEVLTLISISPKAVDRIKSATERDDELIVLMRCVRQGWPNDQQDIPSILKPYWNFRDEISELDGLLYKGQKLIIPSEEKPSLLNQIHTGHQGIQRTLSVARNNVFWLNMTREIIDYVAKCSTCEKTQRSNNKEEMIVKEIPTYPFEIVATDLFSYAGRDFVLMVDSYSGYYDFRQLRQTSSWEVIENLKSWFATHGIPAKLESDNGPQYSSQEFRRFAADWDFEHVTSSPHYPKSNGLAERFVQTAKNLLKKCAIDKTDIKLALLTYRNTPRSDALGSPNQRLLSRITRSLIPTPQENLKPKIVNNVSDTIRLEREKQKSYHDRNSKPASELQVGDKIRLQTSARNWTGATILRETDKPRSFMVKTDSGKVYRRNTIHLHHTQAKFDSDPEVVWQDNQPTPSNLGQTPTSTNLESAISTNQNKPHISFSQTNTLPLLSPAAKPRIEQAQSPPETQKVFTRSGREVKKIVKMNL